jgi:DNA uptake protein ComE-like DNA-binding protein
VAVLLAGTLVSVSRVTLAGTSASLDAASSRSLASSAALAYLTEIEDQREDLLEGERPRLSDAISLFELDDGRRAIARLLPMGDGGALAQSESAKLDVNTASVEALSSLELLDVAMAERIVASRAERPFTTLTDLLSIDGVDEALLFGERATVQNELRPLDERGGAFGGGGSFGGGMGGGPGVVVGGSSSIGGAPASRLAESLTVFSFDPNVSLGVFAGGDRHRGERRINVNQPWSDELREPIEERFGEAVAEAVQRVMESERITVDSLERIVLLAVGADASAGDIRGLLDGFTVSPDPYLRGLIDVNRASAEVLATLPGVDADLASRIVATRDTLSAEDRLSPMWLVTEDLLPLPAYAEVADAVTARSMQWRVRIEAGIERQAEGPASSGAVGGGGARTGELTAVALSHRVVLDVVFDVSGPRARLAALRDVTLLGEALELASMAEPPFELGEDLNFGGFGEGEAGLGDGELDIGTGDDPSAVQRRRDERAARRERVAAGGERASFFVGENDADWGGGGLGRRRGMSFGDLDLGGGDGDVVADGDGGGGGTPRDADGEEGVDRRFGRWTPPRSNGE